MNKSKKVLVVLDEAGAKAWDKIPAGKKSEVASEALQEKIMTQEESKLAVYHNLNSKQRDTMFRLTENNEPVWVHANHPKLMKIPETAPLTVCPRCYCMYYGGHPELDGYHSSTRGYCPECVKETIKRTESEIKHG